MRLPLDKPLRAPLKISIFLAGCAMPVLASAAAMFPRAVEYVFADHVSQWATRFLGTLTSPIPFSVAELGTILLCVLVLLIAVRALARVTCGRRRLSNALALGALNLGAASGVLLLSAYGTWGFNFARADLVTRQGWSAFLKTPPSESPAEELARYCSELVERTNREFESALGTPDPGHPSAAKDLATVDESIEEAYERVAETLHLGHGFAAERGRAKPVVFSILMSRFLIAGFYSPWTGEANYNRDLPPFLLPHTLAHEKAHQRGITNEDEANFFGYLACTQSRNPYARYSGELFAQRQLLGELRRISPDKTAELVRQRHGGIQRDVDSHLEYARRYSGLMSSLGAAAIDAYLKANRAPGGIDSYSRSSRLIVVYARARQQPSRERR